MTEVRTQRCYGGSFDGFVLSHKGSDGDIIYLPFFAPGRPLRFTGEVDEEGNLVLETHRAEYVVRPPGLYFVRYASNDTEEQP